MLPSKTALILNFTGNTYHWGCFGTSYEIYQTLLEHDYAPSFLSVNATHILRPAPENIDELISPAFTKQVMQANPFLQNSLAEADLVVINGEGTLHGFSSAPRNLLFFAYIAKHVFKKKVHLINHSFYPSDSRLPSPESDAFYATAVRDLDSIVTREIYSLEIYKRLGIPVRLGFDCLPRFMKRHAEEIELDKKTNISSNAPLLISGGVTMPEEAARRIARSIKAKSHTNQPILFLTGAKTQPAHEDAFLYKWMQEELPQLTLVKANSFKEWTQTIANAACLISGRFHHTIAAATLGTPCVIFPSNTPKLDAIADMLGFAPAISYNDSALETKMIDALKQTMSLDHELLMQKNRIMLFAFAEENFKDL